MGTSGGGASERRQAAPAGAMRANADLVIRGQRVLLVPYRREHVALYHEWMKDPVLQARAGERGESGGIAPPVLGGWRPSPHAHAHASPAAPESIRLPACRS